MLVSHDAFLSDFIFKGVIMNIIRNIVSELGYVRDDAWQQSALKVTGGVLLSAVCAYGGTHFFTTHHPLLGAAYFASVALISQVAYRALEKLKDTVDKPLARHVITVIQLLQIPYFFYALHAGMAQRLSASAKLEIIIATAHFAAIPVFCHLAIVAWNDPTVEHITAAIGVMLPLAGGLRSYVGLFS